MTIIKRRLLVIFFILLFLVLAPIIVFYANGNILSDGWNILATGGDNIRSMKSGSELIINEKHIDNISFFTRDYLLKNLKPGTYNILVKKNGYNDWTKKINVYPSMVSESNVFMLPAIIDVVEIKPFIITEKVIGTTTKMVSSENPNYQIVKDLFSNLLFNKDISVLSTTTGKMLKYPFGTEDNPVKNRHQSIWKEGGDVFINWTGDIDSSPKIFCTESDQDVICKSELKVYSFNSDINSLDFFPGESGVIIVSVEGNIYAVEVEENLDKKLQVLYNGEKADFRVFNNLIYIRDGDFFGQVEI